MSASATTTPDAIQSNGRARLLRAGLKLFAQNGFDGTSVRDIAAEAGVSFGLIRKYFGSKDGLRDAIEEYVIVEMQRFYGEFFQARSASPEAAVQSAMDYFDEDRHNMLMYLRFALLHPGGSTDRLVQRYVQMYTDVVNTLIAQGQINQAANPRWAALMLLFMQLGPMMLEPFSDALFGQSIYSAELLRERQQAYINMLTEPLLAP